MTLLVVAWRSGKMRKYKHLVGQYNERLSHKWENYIQMNLEEMKLRTDGLHNFLLIIEC
jgi:hypothetical protein